MKLSCDSLSLSLPFAFVVLFFAAGTIAAGEGDFILTESEKQVLESLKETPIRLGYFYEVVYAKLPDGSHGGMIAPFVDLLEKRFGLKVELRKLNWEDAFNQTENGEIDFYGPISLNERRRKEYVVIDPIFQGDAEIVTRIKDPLGALVNLTNKKIGLLNRASIQQPLAAYLPPEGKIVFYPTLEAMMQALEKGDIYCFATTVNAELEIMRRPPIDYEQLLPNFSIEQGFIGKNETLKPLVALINRYLRTPEGQKIIPATREAKRKELIRAEQVYLANYIAAVREKFKSVKIFDSGSLYPLSYTEKGRWKGMLAEIHEIFRELTGVPIEVLNVDYLHGSHQTASEILRNGQCQLIASQYSRSEIWNSPDFEYSEPVWRDTIRAYTYGSTGKSLREMRAGTTKNCAEFFSWDMLTGTKPEIFESRQALLTALKQGTVDVAFISEMSFNDHYAILKDYKLHPYGDISAVAFLRYLYSEKNPELNRLMDEAIKLHHAMNPHARVEWGLKAEKYKSDLIRVHDFQHKVYIAVGVVVTTLVAGIVTSLYRFRKYDRQVRALIQRQQTFDLAWGNLKKRWFISKGDHPFFRQWGLNFSGPSCSMDELANSFGWSLYDDYAEDMKEMKEKGLDFIVKDKKVISSVDGKEKYYRRYMHRLSEHRFMSCLQDITEQHEAEIQERFLNELFASLRDGLVFFDRDMKILKYNAAMSGIIPVRDHSEEICYKAVHGKDEPCERCPIAQTFKDGLRHTEEYYFHKTNRWVEISSYPINDPKTGEVIRALELARDITEQRNWENTLQEREKYLAAILEASNDGIIAVSELDGKSHVNSRFVEMFDGGDPETFRKNISLETLLGLHKKVTPQWKEVNDARLLAMKTLQPQSGTLELYDGRVYEWQIVPVELGIGERSGITRIWTYRDVTERFKAAETIQKSELKFRTIFNATPSGLALFDAVYGPEGGRPIDFRYADVNPALEKINRMSKDQLIGRNLLEFFSHIRIDSGKLDGETILTPCLLAMEGEPGVYTSCYEKYNSYQQLTVFKTETDQLAIFVTDDTARVLDERSLRTMHNVIDHISEPIVWVDQDGILRYINEAGSEFYGYAGSEPPLGKEIWLFDTALSPASWPEFFERISKEGTLRFETFMKRKDGGKFPAHVVADRIEIDGNRMIAACFRDMTEQVRRIEAEQTARAKSRFLDHMSHEIRTPLNGMIGMTTLLSETELTSKQKGYVDLAQSSGKQLLAIVNGILDFSDINAGRVVLHPARFDFSGLIHSVIAQATETLDEKDTEGRIAFDVKYATAIPRYLIGDMERLEQIFYTLLDNAIKFTELGKVTLIVSDDGHESRDVGTPCILKVEVIDTGIGISDEKMQHLYESFVLGDASFSRKYGGTGLGLVVAKSLVQLMGGAVYSESKVATGKGDGGSRFWFVIPLPIDGSAYLESKEWTARKAAPLPLEAPQHSAALGETDGEPSKDDPVILVVEDNKINRIVVCEILKNAGFHFEVAENGLIACEAIAAKKFSLILMDCQMPVMDGFEATRTIRNMEAGTDERKPAHSGHIPIIALTANAMKGDAEACLQVGMDAFCGKPVEAPYLLASIRNWI